MRAVQVWPELRSLRGELADRFDALGPDKWEAPSWCSGWRVRDVLGHLVHLAEATQMTMTREVLRAHSPDRALDGAARRLGAEPVPILATRLRQAADGRFHVPGFPAVVTLGEVIVHGSDALRALGEDFNPPAGDVLPVLSLYRRIGRLAFHGSLAGRRLVATDIEWTGGRGPEIRGRAVDLLLLLANRRQVMPCLEGAGISGL